MNISKMAAPILRGVGFLIFPLFFFYFLTLLFVGDIREAWWCGPIAMIGLAMIWTGDYLKKNAGGEAQEMTPDSENGEAEDRPKVVLSNIVGAVFLSMIPGAGQAFNGERTKAYVYAGVFIAIPLVLVLGLKSFLKPAQMSGMPTALLAIYVAVNLIAFFDALFTAIRQRKIAANQRGGGWAKGLVFAIAILVMTALRKILVRSLF